MRGKSWGICAVLLLLDVCSKWMALLSIPPQGIPCFRTALLSFSFDLAFNTGAAWGMFSGWPWVLCMLRGAVVLGLGVYLLRYRQESGLFPLGLLLTGAVGNILDTFFYGHVIDFLHVFLGTYSFPIFNLADSYITFSFAWMMWRRYPSRTTHVKPT